MIEVDNDLYRIISIVSLIEDKGRKKYNIYKLEGVKDYKIKFIYINSKEKLYMLLVEYPFNNFFNEEKLLDSGYNKLLGQSMVIENRGAVDYYLLDNIEYTIYSKDENVTLIQKSKKNNKYLKGKKISSEDFSLKNHDSEFLKLELENKIICNSEVNKNTKNKKIAIITTVVIAALILIILIFAKGNDTNLISNNINQNNELTYLTSIISNEKKSEDAMVYESDLKPLEVADIIIEENKDSKINVLKNKKESVIVMITDDEYCTVYIGDEYKTFIQISSREYVYFSSNDLYRPAFTVDGKFYRETYYKTCFNKDKEFFSGKSFFETYK